MLWRTLIMASLLPSASLAAQAHEQDSSAVLAVVRGFHGALAASDSLAALGHLHADVLIYENGHAETLTEYRGGHLAADIAFAAATQRAASEEDVELRGDAALYTSRTHTTGEWRERAVDARGVETMVLVRSPDGWRIRHIHWSSRR